MYVSVEYVCSLCIYVGGGLRAYVYSSRPEHGILFSLLFYASFL